jgi:hypothetical protein
MIPATMQPPTQTVKYRSKRLSFLLSAPAGAPSKTASMSTPDQRSLHQFLDVVLEHEKGLIESRVSFGL